MVRHINNHAVAFVFPINLVDLVIGYRTGVALTALRGMALRHLEPEPTGHAQWPRHRAHSRRRR